MNKNFTNKNELRNVLESSQFAFENSLNKFYLSISVNLPSTEITIQSDIHFGRF